MPPRAEQHCNDYRATDVHAERKSYKYKGYFVTVADGCKRKVAYKLARDKAVCDVVELLKNDAAEQRQAELPEHLFRFSYRRGFSYRQIFFHKTPT